MAEDWGYGLNQWIGATNIDNPYDPRCNSFPTDTDNPLDPRYF